MAYHIYVLLELRRIPKDQHQTKLDGHTVYKNSESIEQIPPYGVDKLMQFNKWRLMFVTESLMLFDMDMEDRDNARNCEPIN